jgi:two-component system, cell cycle response regulator CpdR
VRCEHFVEVLRSDAGTDPVHEQPWRPSALIRIADDVLTDSLCLPLRRKGNEGRLLDDLEPTATLLCMGHEPNEVVLLVEDDPAILRLYGMGLEQYGFRVVKAGTAAVALQRAREMRRLDILITDLVLLGPTDLRNGAGAASATMHGIELMRRIVELRPTVKVILISGHPVDITKKLGRVPPPGTAFLQKPFTIEVLTETIKQLLSNADALRKGRNTHEPVGGRED